jgi:hypothetical protein
MVGRRRSLSLCISLMSAIALAQIGPTFRTGVSLVHVDAEVLV